MKRILFVDDEPKILTGLRRMLRSLRREWEMVFAEGGAEALDQCAAAPFDVVVSDARMPKMEGSQLFAEVMRLYPETVRMILSGQCSRRSVLRCVGVAHQFLSKPCDPETLKSALRRMCRMRDAFPDAAMRRAVSRVRTLPSRPTAYAALTECVQSSSASADDAAEIISSDVGMAAKTMQLVSSGFFGSPQRVADAVHAVRLLGLDAIRALLDSSVAFAPADPENFSETELEQLADHSRAVASTARRIAESVTSDRTIIGDAFMAGMLHEIGAIAAPPAGQAREPEPGEPLTDGAGFDPGGYLAALWGLPEPIAHAIGCHRAPSAGGDAAFAPLTALHAAHALLDEARGESGKTALALDVDYLKRTGCADRLDAWRELCAANRPEGALA